MSFEMSLSQSWQDVAFEAGDYVARPAYAAVLTVLVQATNSEAKQGLRLNGNQPTLTKCRLVDQDILMVLKTVEKSAIKSLDLSYNCITDTGAKHIADFLKSVNCCLEVLDLRYNDIGSQGAQLIADSLHLNTSVKELSLDGNPIKRNGGIQVAAMLQINRTLERLGLSSADLHTDCVIAMGTVLQGNSTLKSLDLSRPLLHSKMEESTIHLSRMLLTNCALCELHLSKHTMTDTGVEWLCRTLGQNPNSNLQILDLSCNKLSRDGAKYLSKLLVTNVSLATLDLSYNRIEDEGLQHISQALETNRSLKRLDVRSNSIGTVGLKSLISTLSITNESLSTLLVWGNTLHEPTALAFHELFQAGRFDPSSCDVKPYEVDGVTYLARTDGST